MKNYSISLTCDLVNGSRVRLHCHLTLPDEDISCDSFYLKILDYLKLHFNFDIKTILNFYFCIIDDIPF